MVTKLAFFADSCRVFITQFPLLRFPPSLAFTTIFLPFRCFTKQQKKYLFIFCIFNPLTSIPPSPHSPLPWGPRSNRERERGTSTNKKLRVITFFSLYNVFFFHSLVVSGFFFSLKQANSFVIHQQHHQHQHHLRLPLPSLPKFLF